MVVYKTELHLKNDSGNTKAIPCALLYCFGSLSYCVFPNLFQLAVFQYCPYSNYQTYVRLSALLFCFGGLCIQCCVPCNQRIKIRKQFGIEPDLFEDCFFSMFCLPCVLCQNYAEVKPDKKKNPVEKTTLNTDFDSLLL
ncbi:unnamed protein product [Oikopleura dioica]|uniref:Uncharacterized protein n=1 Tax=Oikopleura dioica TaxID=34765 RepID=E4YC26_OIKDI|nr:unnamed protein product [Oikopleura dioica]